MPVHLGKKKKNDDRGTTVDSLTLPATARTRTAPGAAGLTLGAPTSGRSAFLTNSTAATNTHTISPLSAQTGRSSYLSWT